MLIRRSCPNIACLASKNVISFANMREIDDVASITKPEPCSEASEPPPATPLIATPTNQPTEAAQQGWTGAVRFETPDKGGSGS
jgi:hypothetical protein